MKSEFFEAEKPKPVKLVNKRGRVILIPSEKEAQKLRAVGFKEPILMDAKVGDYYPQYDQGIHGEYKDMVSFVDDYVKRAKGDSDILEAIEL